MKTQGEGTAGEEEFPPSLWTLLAGLGMRLISDRLTGEKTKVLLHMHRGPIMKLRPNDQGRQSSDIVDKEMVNL